MRNMPTLLASFLVLSGAVPLHAAPDPQPSEFCQALPQSADPLKPIKGLKPMRGAALRKLVVGSVMTTPYGRHLWDSSTYYGRDGRFSRSVHNGEVGGSYQFQGTSVRETTATGGQQTSFELYMRKDGIIVAHITYHYQGNEVRNYCVSFDRPMRQ
jgi:hypothetical protein